MVSVCHCSERPIMRFICRENKTRSIINAYNIVYNITDDKSYALAATIQCPRAMFEPEYFFSFSRFLSVSFTPSFLFSRSISRSLIASARLIKAGTVDRVQEATKLDEQRFSSFRHKYTHFLQKNLFVVWNFLV